MLGERLKGWTFVRVFTSPLQRASRTCELAGFSTVASVDHDLVEWSYGAYDGKTNSEIRKQRPGWELFRDGCPDGESVAEVAVRADHVAAGFAPLTVACCSFPAGIFSASSRLAGSGWILQQAGVFSWMLLP